MKALSALALAALFVVPAFPKAEGRLYRLDTHEVILVACRGVIVSIDEASSQGDAVSRKATNIDEENRSNYDRRLFPGRYLRVTYFGR